MLVSMAISSVPELQNNWKVLSKLTIGFSNTIGTNTFELKVQLSNGIEKLKLSLN